MKIPLAVRCVECDSDNTVQIDLADSSLDFRCSQCDYQNLGAFDLRFTIGDRLARRAIYELRKNHDPSLSIVFAAMAMDCELSRLHHKWERIEGMSAMQEIPEAVLDERLRRFGSIAAKIEGIAKLMHAAGIEDFVAAHAELRTTIDNGFTTIRRGSLATDFQRQLFWPRNRILHAGYSGYNEREADRCITLALLGLSVFESLDLVRRATL